MLEEMSAVGEESVSWQPHGKAFRVHLPDLFAKTVMPRYFKQQTKYKSFQRQLHIYGFHRINKGMDRGAYFHSMFIREDKSLSLLMSCTKIKGKDKSSKAVHHRAAVDPDFYSSETNVDNDQYQDRRNLTTKVLQADPALQAYATTKEKTTGCSKRGPTTVGTTGSSDQRPNEEMPLLNNSAFLFNQEVSGGPPPSSHQDACSETGLLVDWMGQVPHTILSRDEGLASPDPPPDYGYDSSVFEKGHEAWAVLRGVNHQKHGNEAFFEGKRFFHVVETKTPFMEDFSAVANGGGQVVYMPRSA
jgi:hypothetical protein